MEKDGIPTRDKAEVVGAVVMAGFGMRIRFDRQAILCGNFLHSGIESVALRAGNLDFFRIANRRKRVVVQIQGNFGRRNRWMFAEIFGAQQPLFFRSDRGEENRAWRGGFGSRPDARQFEQDAATGGVVNRAVIDVVALRAGFVDSEMIVVRGVQNRLGLAVRV